MARQLTFDLPARAAMGRGDFFVSPGNASAVSAVLDWPEWPKGKLVLVGPGGSGKTHLAHVWAERTRARLVSARELDVDRIYGLAERPVAIENADSAVGNRAIEEAMFHLHNLAAARGMHLLVTASAPPVHWKAVLPDLLSRMQEATTVSLSRPDDPLLAAVMVKQFNDRQLIVDPEVVLYLIRRIERSFASVRRIVEALDRTSLEEGRRITRMLARRVLDRLA